MNHKLKQFSIILIVLLVIAFMQNFLWEALHAVFLYANHDFAASKYIIMLLYVSAVDAVMILFLYFLNAIFFKELFWIKKLNSKKIYAYSLLGLIIATIIELRAFSLNRWEYTSLMPTLFGLGISPIVQLSVTGVISIWLINRLFYKKGYFTK